MLQELLCKIGFHNYDYIFIPYKYQPVEGELEGYYYLRCKCCEKERPVHTRNRKY